MIVIVMATKMTHVQKKMTLSSRKMIVIVMVTKMTHVQKMMTLSSRKMNPEKNEKTKPAYLIKRKQLVRR